MMKIIIVFYKKVTIEECMYLEYYTNISYNIANNKNRRGSSAKRDKIWLDRLFKKG